MSPIPDLPAHRRGAPNPLQTAAARRVVGALLCLAVLIGCGPAPSPTGITRLALLPFENQSGDPSLDWLGEAVPEVLAWQHATSTTVFATRVRTNAAAVEAGAGRVLRGTIQREKAGRLRLDAWLEDRVTRRQILQESFSVRPDESLLAGLNTLAAQLGANPRPYATKSIGALRSLLQAGASASDPASFRERVQAALTADPVFVPAHLARIQYELTRRDLEATRQALAEFRAKVPNAAPSEAAEANQVEAALQNDPVALARALCQQAAARPANVALQQRAAEQSTRYLPPAEIEKAWQRVAALEPANSFALVNLAYARAAQGDFKSAQSFLDRAQVAQPADLNVLDSRAEIEYQAGRFAEAARLFAQLASTKPSNADGQSIVSRAGTKGAYAYLLAGDEKTANALFEKGLAARGLNGPLALASRAGWLYQTNHRDQAFALVRGGGAEQPAMQPAIRATLAAQECLMHAASGQWEQAAAAAAQAGPAGVICGFIAQPAAPEAEWVRRADQRFADPRLASFRQRALAYALALRGHCGAAIAPLRAVMHDPAIVDNTEPRILLGRCYYEMKQWNQMREALTPVPVPPSYEPTFSPLVFPAQLQWRSQMETHYERRDEGKRWADIYRRLAP